MAPHSRDTPALLPPPLTHRRARAQLSCNSCRHGKLKCNRAQACDQCIKRGKGEACRYAAKPVRRDVKENMRERLGRLEGLVVRLMEENNGGGLEMDLDGGDERSRKGSEGEERREELGEVKEFGKLNIGKSETVYVGASHWKAIFQQISEVKSCLEEEGEEGAIDEGELEAEKAPIEDEDALGLLLDAPLMYSREEMLRELPTREKADRLMGFWLYTPDPILHVIHRPAFQTQYNRFWQDPSGAPIMWVALLFSLLSLSSFFVVKMQEAQNLPAADLDPSAQESGVKFKHLAASALIIGDYTKASEFTLEALLAYAQSEWFHSNKSQMKVWLIMGVMIRLALRSGLHRDSDIFPNISPYQGEIRRRIWNALEQLDALASFQLGLPSMVRNIKRDAKPPHNLMDTDFDEDCTQLPPERPLEDFTPVTYSIAKHKICTVFAEAAELSHALTVPCETEIMKIDKTLQEAYAEVPSIMKVKPMSECIGDPPHLIICRFNIEFLYNKTILILHRRLLTNPTSREDGVYARRLLTEAAAKTLEHHSTIYNQTRGGGRFSQVPWYLSSLKTHDFILAAIILCLILSLQLQDANGEVTELEESGYTVVQLKELLNSSYHIWKNSDRQEPEIKKAVQIIKTMLDKIESMSYPNLTSQSSVSNLTEQSPLTDPDLQYPAPSGNAFPMTSELYASDKNLFDFGGPELLDTDIIDYNALENLLDQPANVNWVNWDNFINT